MIRHFLASFTVLFSRSLFLAASDIVKHIPFIFYSLLFIYFFIFFFGRIKRGRAFPIFFYRPVFPFSSWGIRHRETFSSISSVPFISFPLFSLGGSDMVKHFHLSSLIVLCSPFLFLGASNTTKRFLSIFNLPFFFFLLF